MCALALSRVRTAATRDRTGSGPANICICCPPGPFAEVLASFALPLFAKFPEGVRAFGRASVVSRRKCDSLSRGKRTLIKMGIRDRGLAAFGSALELSSPLSRGAAARAVQGGVAKRPFHGAPRVKPLFSFMSFFNHLCL